MESKLLAVNKVLPQTVIYSDSKLQWRHCQCWAIGYWYLKREKIFNNQPTAMAMAMCNH